MEEKFHDFPASLELLSEMEEIQVYGGTTDDVHIYAVESCTFNPYCQGANCVAQCGCNTDPDHPGKPITNAITNCNVTCK